ncbi:MAG: hypothetical protein ACPG4Z_05070 [Chitinophagales bacterium]
MKNNFLKKTAMIVVATFVLTVVLSSCGNHQMKCPTYSKAKIQLEESC